MASEFENRLRKNAAHRLRWARRNGLTAFRLYDRDIPGWRYVVEVYDGHAHVVEMRGGKPSQREEVVAATAAVLGFPPGHVHVKEKEPKPWGRVQYQKLGESGERIEVEENGLRFLVNMTDYLDTGLFLDHRNTRARIRAEAAGRRFLNLFCYTGSFTVYAAAGGAASTTSVDLSNTYLSWAEDNLRLNDLAGERHQIVRSDVTRWVQSARERFDLAVLDPPSYSASKSMEGTFEIQRDHGPLVAAVLERLDPGGVLYFSTSFRGFELDPAATGGWPVEEITPESLPDDIRDRQSHRCYRIGPGGRAAPLRKATQGL